MTTGACDRLQSLAIEGRSLPPDLRDHADSCDECRFFVSLSRNMGASGAPADDGLEATMRALVASGEPLLGRWRIEALLGRGGQGVVCRATDLETEEAVAVKVVRLPAEGAARVAQEVANARRVRHPGVCRTFHFERHGRLGVVVMELVDGPTLAEQRARLAQAPRDGIRVMRAVCEGVDAAHRAGVLHLDLKPRNVLLRGGTDPVVTDFGLSERVGDVGSARPTGGTPAYMAPEQRDGRDVDVRTDVYALGKMLAEVVPDAPRRVRRIVERATAADPAERYPDVRSMLRHLEPRRSSTATRAAAVVAGLFVLLGLALILVPAPLPPRPAWRTDLWSEDDVPRDAWNVARNTSGAALPALTASKAPAGCARHLPELQDGVTQYNNWEHGFAFPRATPMCVNLDLLGQCGPRDPSAAHCTLRDGGEGQLDPGEPRCSERWVDVELPRVERVFAARLWFHGAEETPRQVRVLVGLDDGSWTEVFRTAQNVWSRGNAVYDAGGAQGFSAPSTFSFPTRDARRVRVAMTPCKSFGSDEWADPPAAGWIYEVEVYAHVSRLDAWLRTAGLR